MCSISHASILLEKYVSANAFCLDNSACVTGDRAFGRAVLGIHTVFRFYARRAQKRNTANLGSPRLPRLKPLYTRHCVSPGYNKMHYSSFSDSYLQYYKNNVV